MSTVTKTLRIEKEFVVIINDYVKLVKEVFGFEISANSVIAGSLVTGFGTYLNTFKIITFPTAKFPDKNFSDEQLTKIKAFLVRSEDYLNSCEYGDVTGNEVGEAN